MLGRPCYNGVLQMLFRLVSPVKRRDSSVPQFVQRIPSDVLPLIVGRTLTVPLGADTARIRITPQMRTVRLSLRTRDPAEAKVRHGQVAAAFETHWIALRKATPASLTHKQATALAGDLYRAWADSGADRTIAVLHTPHGWVRDRAAPEEERAAFDAAAGHLQAAIESGEPGDLEPTLGPLVDRLLLGKGIASVDEDARPVLLDAFARALHDAFEARKRNAEGDYSPDPKAERFPTWDSPEAKATAQKPAPSPAGASLTGLVADWWAERKAAGLKPSTHESYRNTMAAFEAFVKHDRADRVTAGCSMRSKGMHRGPPGIDMAR